jgi:hypothetical protein
MAASGGNPLCQRGAPLTGCAPAHPGHDSLRSFPTTTIGFCPTRSVAISRSLLLAWQRYRRPHPRCGGNKFSAGSIALAAPVSAQRQGGWTLWVGEYCDGYTYEDGSYDQCVSVTVLGFGGTHCNRVCPPDPANPAVPLYRGNPVYPARSTCSSKSLNP